MTLRYAAYGSNLHPGRLKLRIPAARLLGTDLHPDYSLRFHKLSHDASGKCGIFEGSSGVHFAVYEMSARDQARLDEIEGAGRGYDRVAIELPRFGRCFTYLPSPDHVDAGLTPYAWYREFVLLGCLFHGFPDDYCAAVRKTDTIPDPDATRRSANETIVSWLQAG
ncbi:MAG: gamma-glutamylcyclotransferase family protein [Woeseiaceae bacterium]|nr:gamma-glutamylcyclotransferase family protein [Woeseiaceae bacterium]